MYHIYHCTQLVDSSFPSSDVGGTLFFFASQLFRSSKTDKDEGSTVCESFLNGT